MRKFIISMAVVLSFLFLLRVFATSSEAPTWTVRLHSLHGLRVGSPIEEAGRQIGQIVGIDSHGSGETDLLIMLDPDARDRLRERSTLVVNKPTGSTSPVLSLVVFDEQSPVLPPGSQINGAESEMELELKRQLMAMEGAVRVLTQQIEELSQTLDKASRSEEKRKLEDSVDGLVDTLQRTRDDLTRVFTQEFGRWKKLYEKLFPPEREKPTRLIS